jgi:CheY-like chemotaxis protein
MAESISSVAQLIAPQLPYLRRFSRMLNGSQQNGDAYVVATLEALVADAQILRRDMLPRAALYHTFFKVWNSVPLNNKADPMESVEQLVHKRLENLSPLPRVAFLLASVEELSMSEIASVLERSEDEVALLLNEASLEITNQMAAKVLIIEDEPLISLEIENLVTDIGHEVVGVATTHKEAVKLAKRVKPELILADIQLADGSSGIDAVGEILSGSSAPVVFITAYPKRLLTGERPEPTYLVPKPFKPRTVQGVISQALFFDAKSNARVRANA